jgi:hypothetical protein
MGIYFNFSDTGFLLWNKNSKPSRLLGMVKALNGISSLELMIRQPSLLLAATTPT